MINRILTAAACAAALAGGMQAQSVVDKSVAFQYFANTADAPMAAAVRVEALGGRVVTGKPFSATEVRRTRQTLGDGTHIDKSEKDKFYRDHEGRTRVEREDGGTIVMSDPATGATTATGNGRARVTMVRSGSFSEPAVAAEKGFSFTTAGPEVHREMLDKMKVEAGAVGGRIAVSSTQDVFTRAVAAPASAGFSVVSDKAASEDLGDQFVNGVMAHGTRSTITIPVGQIGNDREIKVVSERWFSNDLGVLIKSTNNDPRFGETTFELTDIVQGAQDPTLFTMPAGVNVRH